MTKLKGKTPDGHEVTVSMTEGRCWVKWADRMRTYRLRRHKGTSPYVRFIDGRPALRVFKTFAWGEKAPFCLWIDDELAAAIRAADPEDTINEEA